MQQTDRLGLELYEATDNANLLDGYNASMRALDTRDGEVSVLITAASTAAAAAGTAASSAQTDATAALTAAAAAGTAASAAQTDATAALTNLGGTRIEFIEETDKGTKWTELSSSYLVSGETNFDAVVFEDTTTGEGIMMAHLGFDWSSTVTVSPGIWDVLSLRDWQFVNSGSEEIYLGFGWLDFINTARFFVQPESQNPKKLAVTTVKELTGTREGRISATIIARVVRAIA